MITCRNLQCFDGGVGVGKYNYAESQSTHILICIIFKLSASHPFISILFASYFATLLSRLHFLSFFPSYLLFDQFSHLPFFSRCYYLCRTATRIMSEDTLFDNPYFLFFISLFVDILILICFCVYYYRSNLNYSIIDYNIDTAQCNKVS